MPKQDLVAQLGATVSGDPDEGKQSPLVTMGAVAVIAGIAYATDPFRKGFRLPWSKKGSGSTSDEPWRQGWGTTGGGSSAPSLSAWIRSNLGRNCGLNADWSISAWYLGGGSTPDGGGAYYLVDNEDDTWEIVRRWYVHEDYAGLPERYRADADGHNDAIVEIAIFNDYPRFAKAVRWLERNMPRIGGQR